MPRTEQYGINNQWFAPIVYKDNTPILLEM